MKHMSVVKTDKPSSLMLQVKEKYHALINTQILMSYPNTLYKDLWKQVKTLQYNSTIVKEYNILGEFDSKKAKIYTMFLEAGFHNIHPKPLLEWVDEKYDKYKLLHLWSFGRNNIENYIDYLTKPNAGIVFYEGKEVVTPIITLTRKNTVVNNMKQLLKIIGDKLNYARAGNEFTSIEQLGKRHIVALISYNIFEGATDRDAYSLVIWDYKYDKYYYTVNGELTFGERKKSLIHIDDAVLTMKTNTGETKYIEALTSFPLKDKVLIRTHSKYSTIADKIIEIDHASINSEVKHRKEYYYIEVDGEEVWLNGFEHPVGNTEMSKNYNTLALLKGHPFRQSVESAVNLVKSVKLVDYYVDGSIFSIIPPRSL